MVPASGGVPGQCAIVQHNRAGDRPHRDIVLDVVLEIGSAPQLLMLTGIKPFGPGCFEESHGRTPRPSFRKVPSWSSVNACRSCSCVFITIGPYHATGSSSGFPETSRNRIPSSPA